ncbi:MAG: acyl-ACP thioesterase [Deltaproteobacteria bacterium]|nr:acyl-ACP thioesterase [Deltaproteobacteria bacterium]
MKWTWTEDFRIRGYEVGADGAVPVQSLCAYMEEAASLHADELGFSVEALQTRGLSWALARMQLELYALPTTGDLVRVKTWPAGVDKLQYRRDFILSGQDNITFARAITEWVIINLESRRLERVPQFITALQPSAPEYALEKEKLRLEEQDNAPELLSFRVRKADIDRNRHVNNVRFLDWILESVPDEISGSRKLAGLQVMYRAEARYGDTVLARGSMRSGISANNEDEVSAEKNAGGLEFAHGLYRCSDGLELVRAKTVWK